LIYSAAAPFCGCATCEANPVRRTPHVVVPTRRSVWILPYGARTRPRIRSRPATRGASNPRIDPRTVTRLPGDARASRPAVRPIATSGSALVYFRPPRIRRRAMGPLRGESRDTGDRTYFAGLPEASQIQRGRDTFRRGRRGGGNYADESGAPPDSRRSRPPQGGPQDHALRRSWQSEL
jgi:hypothetical protein